jgi:hypothetical protein
MYSDRAQVKNNPTKVRLNDYEDALLERISSERQLQKAACARELIVWALEHLEQIYNLKQKA